MVAFATGQPLPRRFLISRHRSRGLGKTGLMLFIEWTRRRDRESDGSRQPPNGAAHPGQSADHAANGKGRSGRRYYAPVTVLVDERSDGVHISYDRMVSLLAPYRVLRGTPGREGS